MLLFDYFCSECKIKEEVFVNSSDDEVLCSKCGALMIKLLAAPPFHLKGSCWYKDGYGLHTNEKEKVNVN